MVNAHTPFAAGKQGMDELNFSIIPIEIPVTIGGQKYVLREASGEAEIAFNSARFKGISVDSEGKPKVEAGLAWGVGPLLVSHCLFTTGREDPKLNNARVHEAEIRSWPRNVQNTLFEKAKEISGIDQPETAEALNKIIADAQKRLTELEAKQKAEKN